MKPLPKVFWIVCKAADISWCGTSLRDSTISAVLDGDNPGLR